MHMKKVCQYGYTHTQCRCPAKDKTVVTIQCDSPGAHKPSEPPMSISVSTDSESVSLNAPWKDIVDDFLEDDLPTRLDSTLEHHLWWMKDDARRALVKDLMEQINNT